MQLEPKAWLVISEPRQTWHFARTKEDAEQISSNLLKYAARCTSTTIEPLYLQAVQPVPVVKVKPLEWCDHRGHTFPDTWTALTPCGVFEIEERSAGDSPAYFATGPMYAFIADKDSLEEAKAAAQADYERRISAALTATASAEPMVPDGWQLVPKEPTDDMLKALLNQSDWSVARAFGMYSGARAFWKAMLAAAPLPAQGGKADE